VQQARHGSLCQVQARIWLAERGASLGRRATLDDVSDAALDAIAAAGFDWLWLLGVWQTGAAARRISLEHPQWAAEYRELLPDFAPRDVCGSPFAICAYEVPQSSGGPAALARLRLRLAQRGVRLMLDLVPNHTAPDHPWVYEHPEYYVAGSEADLEREPWNYLRVQTRAGPCVLAHGRDPNFPGWPDTLQLCYRHPQLHEAMAELVESIAEQCDGVRCDMAMLVLPEVFARTWGERSASVGASAGCGRSLWQELIPRVRARWPEFVFMAEAYWDLEWALQQQGFDYTYDKRLYDRLRAGDAAAVRTHLRADPEYAARSVRFVENHDEPRAAAVFAPVAVHRAAAALALLVPGLRLVHEGQAQGRRLRTSNHLARRAAEPADAELEEFYQRLLTCLRHPAARGGQWRLLEPRPAWEGNGSCASFVAFSWELGEALLLVAVNYGAMRAQCFVPLPFPRLASGAWRLCDRLEPGTQYERDGADLAARGLFLDVPGWRAHAFEVSRLS
jgi:hypothetical protein